MYLLRAETLVEWGCLPGSRASSVIAGPEGVSTVASKDKGKKETKKPKKEKK